MRQPAVFFGHGSPMNALGGPYADVWRAVGEAIGKPKGVVMVSAHWETHGLGVTAQERPETIHDFGNFGPELHAMQYPAPGSPELARRVAGLVGAQPVEMWGLDHGTWSVLVHVWPEADVPVVQLSLNRDLTARQHYDLARRLKPLRDEGYVIAGSGDFVHNLRTWKRDGGEAYPWANSFNEAVKSAFERGDHDALIDWVDLAEDAQLSVPTDEHYLPLLYVAAQAEPGEPVAFFNDVIEGGSISMTGGADRLITSVRPDEKQGDETDEPDEPVRTPSKIRDLRRILQAGIPPGADGADNCGYGFQRPGHADGCGLSPPQERDKKIFSSR